METIASKDNPKVRSYIKLASQKKERMASGRFVLEGVKLLEEAVWSGLGIESVFITEGCLESGRGELGVLRELSEKTFLVAGAAAGLVAAVFDLSVPVQVGAFIVMTAAALAATRPLVKRWTSGKAVPTNADRVLGQTAKVTEAVDNGNAAGAVYVDGKTWTARSADGSVIPAGTRVIVERIEGVKLLVKPCEKNEEVRK